MTTPTVNGAAVVAQGLSHLGENGAAFQQRYGFGRDDAWCCMFVHACIEDAGATWFPSTAWVPSVRDWAEQNGCWASSSSNPPIGSPVIFEWDGDGLEDHIGIVTGYSGPYVLTVEGNATGPNNRSSYVAEFSRGRDVIAGFLAIDSTTAQGELTVAEADRIIEAVKAEGAATRSELEARSNHEVVVLGDVLGQMKSYIDKNSLLEAKTLLDGIGRNQLSVLKADSDEQAKQHAAMVDELGGKMAALFQEYGEGLRAAQIGVKP